MIGPIESSARKSSTSNYLKERDIKHVRIDDVKTLYEVYEFETEVGRGSFAIVLAAHEKKTEAKFAIKIVNKHSGGGAKLQEVQREIQILKLVTHPNIIYLDSVYESSKKVYMVLELCRDSLAKAFKNKGPFSERLSKKIIRQLAGAVYYLQKNDIVHRDIKLENILLQVNPHDPNDEYYIKLSDFGLSIIKTITGIHTMLQQTCGTLLYMAPEIILNHHYSELCDIWSIGIIIYLLLSGTFPFNSGNLEELTRKICNDDVDLTKLKVHHDALDIIKSTLVKDPAERITALEILKHPWLLQNKIKSRKDETIIDYMKKWKNDMTLPGVDRESLVPINDSTHLSGYSIFSKNSLSRSISLVLRDHSSLVESALTSTAGKGTDPVVTSGELSDD